MVAGRADAARRRRPPAAVGERSLPARRDGTSAFDSAEVVSASGFCACCACVAVSAEAGPARRSRRIGALAGKVASPLGGMLLMIFARGFSALACVALVLATESAERARALRHLQPPARFPSVLVRGSSLGGRCGCPRSALCAREPALAMGAGEKTTESF